MSGQLSLDLGQHYAYRQPPAWPRTLFYASGSNSPGEIRGFASLGIPVGFCAAVIGKAGIAELERHASTPLVVFGDTGAYSEVKIAGDAAVVERKITESEWICRLRLFGRIARSYGPRFAAAAPDFVGDQERTLKRLLRYRSEVRTVAEEGSELLIPLHGGKRGLKDFHEDAQTAVGTRLIPAFPMLKCATNPADLLRFTARVQPRRIHLLGLGLRSARARQLLPLLKRMAGETLVSMDSNLITAAVGRRRDGSAARALTAAQDAIHDREVRSTFRDTTDAAWSIFLDYTEAITTPSAWLGPTGRRRVAAEAALSLAEAQWWIAAPDEFLQAPIHACRESVDPVRWWEHPSLAFALDQAWSRYAHRVQANARRADAIRMCFRSHPATGQLPSSHEDELVEEHR